MRKKLLALALAASLGLSLVACGGSADTGAADTGDSGSSAADTGDAAADTGDASAAGWQSGDTVYIDVPSKAGGGTDLYTRYLTQALGEVCPGVNFVVQNYDTGEVGMEHTKNADPDGLTLNVSHGGAIVQWMTGTTNVSVKDDLKVVAIANLGGPQAIIANPDAPYHNFNELADYMKANPGEVVIGCSLGGTTQMIFVNLVNALTGNSEDATYVQCAAEADKLTQTASGAINIANCSIPAALDYEADGKLTIIGTIGPDMSTLESMSELLGTELGEQYKSGPEQGVDSAVWNSSYYLFAPKDTPDEVCQAINEAVCKANEVQSFLDGNKQMATFTEACDSARTQEIFDTEWAFLDDLIGSMGLKAEGR